MTGTRRHHRAGLKIKLKTSLNVSLDMTNILYTPLARNHCFCLIFQLTWKQTQEHLFYRPRRGTGVRLGCNLAWQLKQASLLRTCTTWASTRWTAFECFTRRIPFSSLHFHHSLILISRKRNDLVDGKINAVLIYWSSLRSLNTLETLGLFPTDHQVI